MTFKLLFVLIILLNDVYSSSDCILHPIESEYQCPRNNPIIDVKLSPAGDAEIQCLQTRTNFTMDLLPEINNTYGKSLSVKFCNFNNKFWDILEKFNMTNIVKLNFEQKETEEYNHLVISKDLFENLEKLEILYLTFSKPILDTNSFANLPNLKYLHLFKNKLTHIDSYFNDIPELVSLDLSRNEIELLPNGVFKNLKKLKVLHLWSNNLTLLNRDMFQGLNNLQLLELSSNKIEVISEDAFNELPNLVNISLRSNNIKEIYSNTFRHNPMIHLVRLSFNKKNRLILNDYLFANFTKLYSIELSDNQLQTVPENIFIGSVNIRQIQLSKNELTSIPETLFQQQKQLEKLDMSENKLERLNNSIFAAQENLVELKIQSNRLKEIVGRPFAKLRKLESLFLNNNKIKTIDVNTCNGLEDSLSYLDLSYNYWENNDVLGNTNFLDNCLRLKTLILSHNLLRTIPILHSLLRLNSMDLSYNLIEELNIKDFAYPRNLHINLRNNQIYTVSFDSAEKIAKLNEANGEKTLIDINKNPIKCDCSNYQLISYNSGELATKKFVDIIQGQCSDRNVSIKEIKASSIDCPLSNGCIENCSCSYRPYDHIAIVDCAFRNFTTYPVFRINISLEHQYGQISLNLSGNMLTTGPTPYLNYDNISFLDLSRNQISQIKWIPPNIKELNLKQNKLEVLTTSNVKLLRELSLQRLRLKDNPWTCNCDALEMQKYLIEHYQNVNTSDVYCKNYNNSLIKITDLCESSPYLTIFLPMILLVLLCCAVFAALYYRYQTEIKIYLYAKNMCLWFVTEEELDKDKEYDVFISYAHQDEKFVLDYLIPELESNERPFKVCIHSRDWIPGMFIQEQIVRSVKSSRRTLVVLSNHFLDSVWGKMEFRTAHTEAINEGRARVIVVIYGDLNENKLEDELTSYMTTNTYIKWEDTNFWNRLKYALPHSKAGFYKRNNKLMLKIDEKFKASSPNSTISTNAPSVTKCVDSKTDVPNGEYPLIV